MGLRKEEHVDEVAVLLSCVRDRIYVEVSGPDCDWDYT